MSTEGVGGVVTMAAGLALETEFTRARPDGLESEDCMIVCCTERESHDMYGSVSLLYCYP